MKIFWIVFGSVIAFLVLLFLFLLFLRVTLIAAYDGESVLQLRVLFFRIDLKKRLFGAKKQKKTEKEQKKTKKRERKEETVKGSPRDFLEFLLLMGRIARKTLAFALARLSIRLEYLKASFGLEDAAGTALLYGAVFNAANALFAALSHFSDFTFDPENVILQPSFSDPAVRFGARIRVKARLIDLIRIYLYFTTSYQEGKEGVS